MTEKAKATHFLLFGDIFVIQNIESSNKKWSITKSSQIIIYSRIQNDLNNPQGFVEILYYSDTTNVNARNVYE